MQQGNSLFGVTSEATQYFGGVAASASRIHLMGAPGGGRDMSSPRGHHQHSDQKSGDALVESATPISSRPPGRSTHLDELVSVAAGGFPDDDALAGEETERGVTGNRWPRQETLALLKIRSDMDAPFRDAILKGPLWEEVSRKLCELGYSRSAKKCKEKFENVHKYYKRTKEGRAGRQDGKNYRFFSQLEALHGTSSGATTFSVADATSPTSVTAPASAAASAIQKSPIVGSATGTTRMQQMQPSPTVNITKPSGQPSHSGVPRQQTLPSIPPPHLSDGISLSSSGSSTSGDSSDGIQDQSDRKRKRSSSESSTQKMMNFFEELMKQVVGKQVALQQRLLDAIEKREEDRMIREEAWKRQEIARLSRELDILAQERVMTTARDAAVIAFLQKVTAETTHIPAPPQPQLPPLPQPAARSIPATPQAAIPPIQPQLEQQQHQQHSVEIRPLQTLSMDIVDHDQEPAESTFDQASSRWPKQEVLDLIRLRSGLEHRYEEAGQKGPLWEEISSEMKKLGYNRSAKKSKEKWENINKYYKKVKESNKKRKEDTKTCPYFHELVALYRKKVTASCRLDSEAPHGGGAGGDAVAIMPTPMLAASPETLRLEKDGGGGGENGPEGNGGPVMQVQKGNGVSFYSTGVDEKTVSNLTSQKA